jgi:AcrR family transcriptional regulator
MGRWQPDARGRLRGAALELFAEVGYEQTTVAAIAERAGVTERTFFRHYADKREVLFDGSAALQQRVVDEIAAAPAGPPVGIVAGAFAAAVELIDGHRDFSRLRAETIAANPGLRERELLKMAALGAAAAAALRERGVPEPAATLAAETGVTIFRVAFDRWLTDGPDDLPAAIRTTLTAYETL